MSGRRVTIALAALVFAAASTSASAQPYTPEVVFAGDGLHGMHGLAFDREDRLYAGSVYGSSIYRIDTTSGRAETVVPAPDGEADDLDFAPDGTLVWTAFTAGEVRARSGDGPVRVLASGFPGMNSLAFDAQGRLFATQVFAGDALWEIDLSGEEPPRLVLQNMGGLNGFDFGPDGKLYGPLWTKHAVARIDVDARTVQVVAGGFGQPAAVNFDSRGRLFVLDSGRGEVVEVNTDNGEKRVVARAPTTMDNLAFDSKDRLYLTVFPENAIYRVDADTGVVETLRSTPLGMPSGLALYRDGDGEETLYVSDLLALRAIDLPGERKRDLARAIETHYGNVVGAVCASERFVHVANWPAGTVQRIDRASGEILETLDSIETPADLVELDDGTLVVAQAVPGTLLRIAPDGTREVAVSGLALPVGLARGPGDTVYVALSGRGEIEAVDLESGTHRRIASGLEEPEALAVGPDGRIFVTEAATQRITVVDPRTGETEVIAWGLPIGMPARSGMPPVGAQSGIAVAKDGTVYFSSDSEDALYALRPTRPDP